MRNELKFNKGSEFEFDKELREINELLGVNALQFKKTGCTDIDLYLRLGTVKDYYYKFRKIDIGATLGCLIPTGELKELDSPSSISFGGDGHFGLYGLFDLNLELKEDLLVGLWFEILNRFSRTKTSRMPVNSEPLEFGAVIGDMYVKPGLTLGFSPYIALEDIRDGFGFKMRYTLIYHFEDDIGDVRKTNIIKREQREIIVKTTLEDVIDNSRWSAEYLTFTLMYDFAKTTNPGKFAPLIYLEWDRPTKILFSDRFARTNRVSFGFEFSF